MNAEKRRRRRGHEDEHEGKKDEKGNVEREI